MSHLFTNTVPVLRYLHVWRPLKGHTITRSLNILHRIMHYGKESFFTQKYLLVTVHAINNSFIFQKIPLTPNKLKNGQ